MVATSNKMQALPVDTLPDSFFHPCSHTVPVQWNNVRSWANDHKKTVCSDCKKVNRMSIVDAKELRLAGNAFERSGRLFYNTRSSDFNKAEVCYNLAAEKDAFESFLLIHMARRSLDGQWGSNNSTTTIHSAAWYLQEATARFERIASVASFYLYKLSFKAAERRQRDRRERRLDAGRHGLVVPDDPAVPWDGDDDDDDDDDEEEAVTENGATAKTNTLIDNKGSAGTLTTSKSQAQPVPPPAFKSTHSSSSRISKRGRANRSPHEIKRQEKRFHTAICTVGVLLADPRNPSFSLERSTTVFELGHCKGLREATFWYGRAVKNGVGCAVNIELGVRLIEQAAAAGIRRALFEMGLLYEYGYQLNGGVLQRKNLPFAYSYYQVAADRYVNQERELLGTYEDDFLQTNPDGNQLADLNDDTATRSLSWQLAVQAVLLVAASNLAPNSAAESIVILPAPDHYASLLFLLPFVGLVFALLSVWTIVTSMYVHQHRRDHLLRKVYTAKRKAIKALLGRYRSTGMPASDPDTISRMVVIGEWFAVVTAVAFLIAWFILLVNELDLKAKGDSEWWTG